MIKRRWCALLQTDNLENLITTNLMGQPYDGVYDVLGNLLLTPRSALAFSSLHNNLKDQLFSLRYSNLDGSIKEAGGREGWK